MTVEAGGRVDEALEAGWSLPAELYADPRGHRLELEHVFRTRWQVAGRAADVAEPGRHLVTQAGDVPIVVVRGEDGVLRGFVNVCRHRLHPVALEAGKRSVLRCSYHGWSYGLDGSLRNAPRCMGEPGFDRAELGLVPVSVGELGSFVFVNPDPDAAPVAEALTEAVPLLDALRLDVAGWTPMGRFEYHIRANWKVFVENALECYHCPLVHKETFAHAFHTDDRRYVCENGEDVLTQVTPTSNAPASEPHPERTADFRLLFAWPASFVAVDEYASTVASVVPLAVDRCRFVVDTYGNPDAPAEAIEEWLEMYNRTFEEDKLVVDRQQAGYATGLVPAGRLVTRSESSIVAFQRRTWRALAPLWTAGD